MVKPLSFARIGDDSYPKKEYEGQENQSSNYVAPHKIQTGDSRGELTIKGLIRVVDSNGTVLLIMGYKKEAF